MPKDFAKLKELWNKGIGLWCKSQDGKFETDNLRWIKFCELPGGHLVRFWNSGDEDPPRRIGVMVYPNSGGKIDLGELDDIGNDWLIRNAVLTKGSEHLEMHRNYFSDKELEGSLFSFVDNPLATHNRQGCFRLNIHLKEDLRGLHIRKKLSAEDYKKVQTLQKRADVFKKQYTKYYEMRSQSKYGTPEYEEYDKKQREYWTKWSKIYDEIRDTRESYPKIEGSGGIDDEIRVMKELLHSADYCDAQIAPGGGLSGEIYHFQFDLPCGPSPSQKTEKHFDTMTLIPAPYSAINQIDESAWEHEFKTKHDAIDFYIDGTHTATTLRELKNMGKKHVRIRFPSGRVEEYDLDVLLKD